MTDYTYDGRFFIKDYLLPTDPLKIVSALEHDKEFKAIETAVNSKLNINNPAFTGTMTGENITISGTLQAGRISGGEW